MNKVWTSVTLGVKIEVSVKNKTQYLVLLLKQGDVSSKIGSAEQK